MSSLKLALVCLLAPLSPLSAELTTLVANNRSTSSGNPTFSTETITLAKGDLATVHYLSNNAYLDVKIGSILVRIDANDPDQTNLPIIAGPATIRLANFTTVNAALATLTVKRAGDPQSVPAQTLVIPDDGSGDRQVSLQSSTDMVNWTSTTPGIFRSADASRFFRVRIVKTEESEE
jgi:hypothetical protein